jgi:ABC-type branched-subunit amino acid transport system substrate-binding protein
MLSNLGKLAIIYSVAGIIGNPFSKAFTKQNIEKGFHVTEFVH